ncbi:hypothetical protein MXB_1251, partial [Myxobolus squamalis]
TLTDFSKQQSLSETGRDELYSIGQRYWVRFSKRMGKDFLKNSSLRFESSCKSRSSDSMNAFITGMFEGEDPTKIPSGKITTCAVDTIYRFFKLCTRYINLHKCLSEFKLEEQKFLNKKLIINITSKINQKLKLNNENSLTPLDIKTLYILCAYNRVVDRADLNDGVCSLFNEESFEAFEYLLDMKHYYQTTNSHELNLDVSCPLFKKTFHNIRNSLNKCSKNLKSQSRKLIGTFGFSHAETLIPILGSFGLFNHHQQEKSNNKINSENFEALKNNRTFRGGYYSPMAGNLLLTVGCSNDSNEGVVMALLNENPIALPCCKENYLNGDPSYPVCSKEEFIKCFSPRAQQCNYYKTCSTPYICNSRHFKNYDAQNIAPVNPGILR